MRPKVRSLATSVVISLAAASLLGMVAVTGVHAQVSPPDYGAGPGVGAGVPLATDPASPPRVAAQPVVPPIAGTAPGRAPGGPSVQQAGPVAVTTLPRTGGVPASDGMAWSVIALAGALIGLLGVVGTTGRQAGRSA